MRRMTQELHIVGGGLAGSEAAWQAAQMGVNVVIHEMRPPKVETFAHQTGDLPRWSVRTPSGRMMTNRTPWGGSCIGKCGPLAG